MTLRFFSAAMTVLMRKAATRAQRKLSPQARSPTAFMGTAASSIMMP